MAFLRDGRRIRLAAISMVLSAVLLWFGTGLNPLWPLMWLAPIPVLLVALSETWLVAGVVAWLAWFLGSLSLWGYLHLLTPVSVWLPLFVIRAAVFAWAVLLFRVLARRGALWSAVLAFPAAWMSWEYVENLGASYGTALSIAYTQLKCLPVLQVASVTGLWGVGFVVFFFAAVVAVGVYLLKRSPRRAAVIVGAGCGAVGLVLLGGAARLSMPASKDVVRVGLVASDAPGYKGVADSGAETEKVLGSYAAQAKALVARGAQVVVVPEVLGVVSGNRVQPEDQMLQELADRSGATIVAGVSDVAGTLRYNQARVYAPEMQMMTYDKEHMMPPWGLMFKPGTSITTMQRASGTWGVAICKDMDFTGLSRRYGEAGVGLMLVPAADFEMDRTWHGHIAVMRAVEDGFNMARAARGGFLTVTDDRGRILAETRSDSAPFATLLAEAPATHDATLYERFGNWFAWLMLAVLGFTMAEAFWLRGRAGD